MHKKFTAKLEKASEKDLYEIHLRSSKAKSGEFFIFEKGEMADFFEE